METPTNVGEGCSRMKVSPTARLGGAALAVKPFELDGVGGYRPSLALVADANGRVLNAARLTAVHYRRQVMSDRLGGQILHAPAPA